MASTTLGTNLMKIPSYDGFRPIKSALKCKNISKSIVLLDTTSTQYQSDSTKFNIKKVIGNRSQSTVKLHNENNPLPDSKQLGNSNSMLRLNLKTNKVFQRNSLIKSAYFSVIDL